MVTNKIRNEDVGTKKILLVEDSSMDGLYPKGPAENFDRKSIYENALPEDFCKIKQKSDELLDKEDINLELEDEIRNLFREYIENNQKKINETYMNCNSKNLTDLVGIDYKIDRAIDIYSGMNKLDKNKYDLVVTDLGLPFFVNVQFPLSDYGVYLDKRFGQPTNEEERDFMDEYKSKLEDKINPVNFKKLFRNAKEQGIELPSFCHADYMRESEMFASGVLIADKANEDLTPNYIFTNKDHHGPAVIAAAIAGNVELSQVNDVFNRLEIPKKGFVKTGNLYIGEKKGPMNFVNVIQDIFKRGENEK